MTTWWMKLGGNPRETIPLPYNDKWYGPIFYKPSRIDEAGHTKAFDYPVAEHWGEAKMFRGWDSYRQHIGPETNALPTEPPRFPYDSWYLYTWTVG